MNLGEIEILRGQVEVKTIGDVAEVAMEVGIMADTVVGDIIGQPGTGHREGVADIEGRVTDSLSVRRCKISHSSDSFLPNFSLSVCH